VHLDLLSVLGRCISTIHNPAPATEATALIKDSYSTAVKGAQDYNAKVIEFANANTEAAFAFAQKLFGVTSPSDFVELSTDHSRRQFETQTEQTKELAALAQQVTHSATAEERVRSMACCSQASDETSPAPKK
jgi:hypothetical protein